MKLIQFHLPNMGKRVGIVTREDEVIDVTSDESPGVLEILELAYSENVSLGGSAGGYPGARREIRRSRFRRVRAGQQRPEATD